MLLLALFCFLSLFSQLKSLENCLSNYLDSKPKDLDPCEKSVCKCASHSALQRMEFTCPNTEANLCFESAKCKRQKNGQCDFQFLKSLRTCLTKADYCKIGGWYKELCISAQDMTVKGPNIYRPENVCYKQAKCEVQQTGDCGWTETTKFKKCMRLFFLNSSCP